MSEQESTIGVGDPTRLPLVREYFAGALAIVMTTLFIALVIIALSRPSGDFASVKELLGIVNPLIGLVIGYYFSRATSEARAERAEAAAAKANDTAQQAVQTQSVAAAQASRALQETQRAKSALKAVVDAASNRPDLGPGVATDSAPTVQFEAALVAAQNVLETLG